ncbi:hypothetical protein YC2023_016903 [Brassica napus]
MISVSTTVCHTDASWKVRAAGLAWIFSDHAGTESSHKAISLNHVSSPLMAEALAIRGALLHATSIKITHICLRSDSQVLIQEICQRKLIMELYGVLSDIDSLSFSAVSPFVSVSPSDLSSDDPIRSQLASQTATARVPRSASSRPDRKQPARVPDQTHPVPAHSSSRSSSFQLAADRQARGFLGGPVLQSSKPKGESHVLHLALTVVLAATAQVDGNIIFDDSYYVLPIYSNGGGLTLPSRGHDTNVPSMLDMNIRRSMGAFLNIGVVVEEYGVPRLALSPMTFSFYFRKATEISSKTMSII